MPTPPSKPVRTLQSLDRAMALLDQLANEPEGIRLTQLSETLDLKLQTVRTLLQTLVHHGLVTQEFRGGPYMMGAQIHRWSRLNLSKMDIASRVQPVFARVAEELGEYMLLAKLQGHTLLRIIEYTSQHKISYNPSSAEPLPVYQFSTGQILLAHLEEKRLRHVLAAMEIPQNNPKLSIELLCQQLQTYRKQGYAEIIKKEDELVSLAVFVDVPAGKGPLALGIAQPLVRYSGADKTVPILKQAASEMQELFGEFN